MIRTLSISWIAEHLGSELAGLTPPHRPRVIPELLALPYGSDGLMVVGTADPQVLRGRSAREVLPSLLPLLDGTRTAEELVECNPLLSIEAVRQIILTLYTRGLLDDGTADRAEFDNQKPTGAYIGRYLDVTRLNKNRGDGLTRLRDARIVVATDSSPLDCAVDLFRSAGVGTVRRLDEVDLTSDDLVFAAASERGTLLRALSQAWTAGTPSFVLEIGESSARIGPMLIGKDSACPNCFDACCEPLSGKPSDAQFLFWTALAVSHAINVVARVAIPSIFNRGTVYQFDFPLQGHQDAVVRLPGCVLCCPEPAFDLRDPEMVAWMYHTIAAMPPTDFNYPRAYQAHFSAKNVELAERSAPFYPRTVEVALPDVAAVAAARDGISLESIATVLWLAGGYRKTPRESHIAPTGGGLKSPELFVAVVGLAELDDGIYHYDSRRHVLVKRNDVGSTSLCEALGSVTDLTACTIIAAGALRVVYQKYHDFAFRVIGLDAGVALAYCHAAAELRGLILSERPNFDEQALMEILALPSPAESGRVVTFAASLREPTPSPTRSIPRGETILNTLIETVAQERVYRLPSIDNGDGTLLDSMLARVSVRTFRRDPIAAVTMGRMLKAALNVTLKRPAEAISAVQLTVASRIGAPDLEEAVFQFDRSTARLFRIRDQFSSDDATSVITQENLSHAPYFIFVSVDLREALVRRGPLGYREALLAAGTVAANIATIGTSMGLATCITAGISAEGFRRLTATDGLSLCPLIAVCVGYGTADPQH